MIVPSIDIMGGRAVQLRGGRYPALDVGDPEELAARYSRVGEIALVDLDAALGRGSNRGIIERITRQYPCRVGGGIRSLEAARRALDSGARSIMVGTMAEPEFLSALPRERLIAALDERSGGIVVEGWTKPTGRIVEERLSELAGLVAGFLVTFVDAEGSLAGIDLERARRIAAVAAASPGAGRVTFAGGAAGAAEVAALDAAGADIQAGTAIATGVLPLAAAFAAPLRSDRPDGLWPTLVCDEGGRALGLAWSDAESLASAIDSGRGVYRSRSRGLWTKGASSGDTQELLRVEADCDRDALRFLVRQRGGFCHRGMRSCFGTGEGSGIERLSRSIETRRAKAPKGSYTARLLSDPELLASKLREEADELGKSRGPAEAAAEAADLVYFALVKARAEGAALADIEAELDRRALRVTRRGGGPKAAFAASGEDLSWNGSH